VAFPHTGKAISGFPLIALTQLQTIFQFYFIITGHERIQRYPLLLLYYNATPWAERPECLVLKPIFHTFSTHFPPIVPLSYKFYVFQDLRLAFWAKLLIVMTRPHAQMAAHFLIRPEFHIFSLLSFFFLPIFQSSSRSRLAIQEFCIIY